jgi:starch phosphorylase
VQARRNHFELARTRTRFSQEVAEKWNAVGFVNTSVAAETAVLTGSAVPLRVTVELAGLTADDVRVEAVVGRIGAEGELADMQVVALKPLEQQGTRIMFGSNFTPGSTGRLGWSVRVCPNHADDPINRPCNALLKWAGE